MNETMEMALKEQRITIRRALDAWVKIGGCSHQAHTLKEAKLNGDTLWMNTGKAFWLGATLVWEKDLGPLIPSVTFQQQVFFHVDAQLAEADARMSNNSLPSEMNGLRQSSTLEDVVAYYMEGWHEHRGI